MKRISVVDSLRGFSLLGIILANLLLFQYGHYGASYPDFYHLNTFNRIILHLIQIFIVGSFLPIFAILFGFGLVKMRESLANNQYPVNRSILRRGFMLVILGYLHAQFFFSGDILYLYGSITIVFFWAIKYKVRSLIILMILLFTTFMVMASFSPDLIEAMGEMPAGDKLNEQQQHYLVKELTVMAHGTLSERNAFTLTEDPFLTFNDSSALALILLVILLTSLLVFTGMIFAKNDFFTTGLTKTKKLLIYSIPVSLLLKALMVYFTDNESLVSIGSFAYYSLSFGYISLFYVLYQKFNGHFIFELFKSVGKLSLTNYILQSVFHSFIYYGYGLQRFGSDNFVLSVLIAIIFFIFQMFGSYYYLKFFKYGPLEYILRVFTYFTFKPRKYQIINE